MTHIASSELEAVLHHAALATLEDRAFLRITGSDATRWLNGMVTNSVQALAPGEGCYNFLLNAQGRILADCTVYREPAPPEPATFLLQTESSQLAALQRHLDHFIIMDDVELTPAFDDDMSLLVIGPEAARVLAAAGLPTPDPLRFAHAESPQGPVQIFTPFRAGIPRFQLRSSVGELLALRSVLLTAGAREVSHDAVEAARLLEGSPRYGQDITDKHLPQEANQPHALHFNKGCYLGQEIVERIRSRGQVHRVLTPLTLTGELPPQLPASLQANGQPAGEITSAILLPVTDTPQIVALGYVRREPLDTHQPLTYTGGAATPRSTNASH